MNFQVIYITLTVLLYAGQIAAWMYRISAGMEGFFHLAFLPVLFIINWLLSIPAALVFILRRNLLLASAPILYMSLAAISLMYEAFSAIAAEQVSSHFGKQTPYIEIAVLCICLLYHLYAFRHTFSLAAKFDGKLPELPEDSPFNRFRF